MLIFNRFLNIFLLSLIALQLISCAGDRRYRLSSDFDFVSRNNFIVYEVFAPEPPSPDDFLNTDGSATNSNTVIGGLTPNTKPNPKSKPDPKSKSNPSVPPQPPVQPQPDPSDPSVPHYTCDGLECVADPQPQPQPPVPPVNPPQPPNSFKYCDDFFDPLTGFDWSKLFSKEFSTCVLKSN